MPGFVWYELMTTDAVAARTFYSHVVGWTMRPAGMGSSDYTLLCVGESAVGGLMPLPQEACDAGARPAWIGYIGVDDVDAAAAKVSANGGSIRRPPQDMEGVGRFAVAADPHGAAFVLFQPFMDAYPPISMDTPGAVAWRELMADDGPSAFDFYAATFGWEKDQAFDMGPMGVYQLFRTGGDQASGGMMTRGPEVPAAFWGYYFTVENIDAGLERLTGAGGRVLNGPMEVPGGMWVVQALDPQGIYFCILGPRA